MQENAALPVSKNPLGTEKIGKLILKFSVPAIISMLVNAIYNIVDQIFIGQGIGMLGIAATNIAFPLTTVCTAIGLLLGAGGAANFNLRLGAGKKEAASTMAGNAISLLAISGVAIAAVVLLFLQPMLRFFGATELVMPYATPYAAITAPGIPFLIFSTGAVTLIRADGSPNYAMASVLAGAVFNVIFDPIFLFVFGMGIEGIALATLLGQILSAGITLFYLMRRFRTAPLARRHLRPRAEYGKAICALGAGPCVNQLAMMIVQIALNNILKHYGALSPYGSEIPLAAVGAISKLTLLFLSLTIGIGQGCQPINSFNYGAGNYARVKQCLRTALIAASIISAATFLMFQLFPGQLMTIFGEDEPLYLEFAVRYLRIFMMMTFVNGIHPVVSNFFTSIGRAKMGILISMTRQILFLLPLLVLLPLVMGIDGVMVAGPIADGTAALLSFILVMREYRRMTALQAEAEAGHG